MVAVDVTDAPLQEGLVSEEITIGEVAVIVSQTESTEESVQLTVPNVGDLVLTPDSVKFSFPPVEGKVPTISIPFPEEVDLTDDFGFVMAEFLLNQLQGATDNVTGCDSFVDDPCNQGCCDSHALCYTTFECTPVSWTRTLCEPYLSLFANGGSFTLDLGSLGPITCEESLFFDSGECSNCNAVAVGCVASGCSGVSSPSTSETCYDHKCNDFYTCPGTCSFASLNTPACCGCRLAGENCASEATCGNGVCDFEETIETCFADCAFNTCEDEPGFVECSGVCIDPNTNAENCGFCGITCLGESDCVLGRCSVPLTIEWTTETDNDGEWLIINDGKTIRFDIEDSFNCGGTNSLEQTGLATASVTTTEEFALTIDIIGIAELEDAGFELMRVSIDGVLVISATSNQDDLGCAMGPVDVTTLVAQPYLLAPGDHNFQITFTTNDGLYHVGAFYELNLAFTPVNV